MITSKTRGTAQRSCLCLLTLALLATGCSSLKTLVEPGRIDYKSAKKTSDSSGLEIPPDLTQLQRDNRYAIPDANARGMATASGYNAQQGPRVAAPTESVVLPQATNADVKIERSGNQRWLVVGQTPDVLWPQIREFWQDAGFLINSESQEAGIMETDWAEDRAKIPQDFIRNTLGKVLDSLYSTGLRDKFRTRLERGPDGTTEIYISHRGAEEMLVGREQDSTVWTPRPSNPELEAEFLSRLMARLGDEGTKEEAKSIVANAQSLPDRAKLVKAGGGDAGYVEVSESFDRAWRRVGLALDRVGFTVEDRDRSQGLYFVRYIDQAKDAQNSPGNEKGFLRRLFSSDDKEQAATAQRYRVLVKAAGEGSQVTVLNNSGQPVTSSTADRILGLLNDQLR